jgi:hypothetical protein
VCGKSEEAWNEQVGNEKLKKTEGVDYPSGRGNDVGSLER